MINIYTDIDKVDKDRLLYNVEPYFNDLVLANEFSEEELDAMKAIDNAKLLDRNNGAIETPFGIGYIENLSTGCKTILMYLYMLRHKELKKDILDISGCGANALEHLFTLMEKKDNSIELFIMHRDSVAECGKRDYNVNGKIVQNLALANYSY